METFITRTRSHSIDAVLSQSIEHALATSGYMPLCSVEVSVHEGVVTLAGHVPTYYLKQMAQNIVVQQGIELLSNNIEVVSTNCSLNRFMLHGHIICAKKSPVLQERNSYEN
jgi:osmotically-inducible protein OsmY